VDEPTLEPGAQLPATPAPVTFTRDELDAAEPVRPPSARRRWLMGFVIGAIGGWALAFGTFLSLIALAALPFAFTPAGAGALTGATVMFGLLVIPIFDLAAGVTLDLAGTVSIAVAIVVAVAGLSGTVVVFLRARGPA
jgi:sterol desaturase/sphingolipid hydroxylase (fatty acid hydroxylase superfamily)